MIETSDLQFRERKLSKRVKILRSIGGFSVGAAVLLGIGTVETPGPNTNFAAVVDGLIDGVFVMGGIVALGYASDTDRERAIYQAELLSRERLE
jgi:hypothetical protein